MGCSTFLLGFGISTKVVLLLDVAVGGVILLAAAAWMFRKKLDNDWLLWYAVTAVVSVMWFYKQSHDYIILALPAIAIFCLPHISLPAWGSILILLVDVIAFAVPKVCTCCAACRKMWFRPGLNCWKRWPLWQHCTMCSSLPSAMRRHCSRRARMDNSIGAHIVRPLPWLE